MRSPGRWISALGIGTALGISMAAAGTPLGSAGAQVRVHPLDVWLSAHPAIAHAIVWEFPPSVPLRPLLPRRFIVWQGPDIAPDPALFPPLDDSVLPEPIRGLAFDPAFGTTASDPNVTTVQIAKVPDPGWTSTTEVVPGNLPEGVPGGVKISEYGAEIRSWPKWPDWAKDELRARYADYHLWAQNACGLYAAWAATGFTVKPTGFDAAFSSEVDLDPVPLFDPPANLQPDDPLVPSVPWAMVPSGHAFHLYARIVAAQLAMETSGCLPWSVLDYTAADLRPLFDGRLTFRFVPAGSSQWGVMTATGHVVATTVTPAPPLKVLGFLAQHALIGTDRADTVARFLDWERFNLRHVVGGSASMPYASGVFYWGYNGRPPVSRMIAGTVMPEPLVQLAGPAYFDPEVRHWVGGCGGASGFNEQVLRVVNIPVHRTVYSHFQNRFVLGHGLHAGIGHGDDPYSLAGAPEIPISGLLIDAPTFDAWFVNEPDPAERLKKVARRPADLFIQYLPIQLLQFHCWDVLLGNTDRATSRVYTSRFASTYSVAELEAMGLWTNIEAKIAALGGCQAIW